MRFVASLFLMCAVSACQTTRGKHTGGVNGGTAKTSTGTPVVVPPAGAPIEPPPPPPTPQEIKKVAVILGPGGAKALAHVGVLKAFQQQRLPINKIIGLEWGALVGGLYAAKGQVNDVEWKLYKMEQKNLPRPKGFFSHKLGEDSVKIMDEYFQDVFAGTDLRSAKIPFACPSRSIWTGVVNWQNRGQFKDVMKRCLPFPPLFKAGGTFIAGASQVLEAIDQLRGEGYNVIILVNVLGSAMPVGQDSLLDNLNYVILWQEIKRAASEASRLNIELVNVETDQYPMVQFEAKKELISAGEQAGGSAAQMLIQKYGF